MKERGQINGRFRLANNNRILSFAQSLAENAVFFARLFLVAFCRKMSKNLTCESELLGTVQCCVCSVFNVYFCAHFQFYSVAWKYSEFHQGIFAGYYARKDAFSCAVFGTEKPRCRSPPSWFCHLSHDYLKIERKAL